ncbi:class GN sortase [Gammaproteobacteria bacterium]|nr:class GN sortase [Gammaproteobacteria bacterium]
MRGLFEKLSTIVALTLLLVGSWQFGTGIYMAGKARLAQILLSAAWARTSQYGKPTAPWPWADTYPVARLEVPGLDIDQIILAGASGRTLAFGPAHVDGSAAPGSSGTSIISGHRDTHFEFLRHLQTGDLLIVSDAGNNRRRYRVDRNEILDTRNRQLRIDPANEALVLVTCFPFDALIAGGPLRYLVHAEAVLQ